MSIHGPRAGIPVPRRRRIYVSGTAGTAPTITPILAPSPPMRARVPTMPVRPPRSSRPDGERGGHGPDRRAEVRAGDRVHGPRCHGVLQPAPLGLQRAGRDVSRHELRSVSIRGRLDPRYAAADAGAGEGAQSAPA